jgi:hypothetical protein
MDVNQKDGKEHRYPMLPLNVRIFEVNFSYWIVS